MSRGYGRGSEEYEVKAVVGRRDIIVAGGGV